MNPYLLEGKNCSYAPKSNAPKPEPYAVAGTHQPTSLAGRGGGAQLRGRGRGTRLAWPGVRGWLGGAWASLAREDLVGAPSPGLCSWLPSFSDFLGWPPFQ
jgi:hypothetical protein